MSSKISRKAIVSLVLGGVAVASGISAVAFDLPSLMAVMLASTLLAIILGAMARREVHRGKGEVRGSGLAGVAVGLGLMGAIFAVMLPFT
jgi:hypothetical protein